MTRNYFKRLKMHNLDYDLNSNLALLSLRFQFVSLIGARDSFR